MSTELEDAIVNNVKQAIERKPRLTPAMTTLLNTQIMNELYSANLYKQLSAWLDDNNWSNGAKLFLKYGNEEVVHADTVISYMYDMNCKVDVAAIPKATVAAKAIRDILNASLQHEIVVTEQWRGIAKQAMTEGDFTTLTIAQEFMKEQVEEETKFRNYLFLLNLKMFEYKLDMEFAKAL